MTKWWQFIWISNGASRFQFPFIIWTNCKLASFYIQNSDASRFQIPTNKNKKTLAIIIFKLSGAESFNQATKLKLVLETVLVYSTIQQELPHHLIDSKSVFQAFSHPNYLNSSKIWNFQCLPLLPTDRVIEVFTNVKW